MGSWQARVGTLRTGLPTGPPSRGALGVVLAAQAPGRRRRRRLERLTQRAGVIRRPAALGESPDLEHADRPVERNRHHVAGPHRAAWRINAPAVNAHVTGGGETRRRRARAHYPRVPKPFVDPLLVQAGRPSARLLGVRLEMLLERSKLGER